MSKKIFFLLLLSCLLFSILSCNNEEEAKLPTISSITPSAGMTNSIDFQIAIGGQNFTSDTIILFDNVPISTTYVDGNNLRGVITNSLTGAATVSGGNGALSLGNKQVFVKVQNSVGVSEQRGFSFYDNWNFPALSNVSSGDPALGLDMTMAQDSDGVLYAIWSHLNYTVGVNPTGLEIRFARSDNGGTTWSTPQKINSNLSLTAFDYPTPQIMIGTNKKLSVLFTRNDPDKYYSYNWITSSTDGGNTWSEPSYVNPSSTSYAAKAEYSPSFYIEPNTGNVHNTWGTMTYGYKNAIYYSHSLYQWNAGINVMSETFSEPVRISDYTTVMQGESTVIANGNGDVHVVWFQPASKNYYVKELCTASSADWGNTFGEPKYIADKSQINQWWPMQDITVDQQGNVYIVYVGPFNGTISDIVLQKSSDHGATYSSPINLTDSTATRLKPFITSDPLGNLTLIYQEVSNNTATIFSRRSTDGGNTFSLPIAVATVNLYSSTSAILKNPPHATADFYPSFAPMARLFMTLMNRPLIVCGSYHSSISFLESEDEVRLYELLYSLGTAER